MKAREINLYEIEWYFEDEFSNYKNDIIIAGNRDYKGRNEVTEIQWIDEGDDPEECGWYSIEETFSNFTREGALFHILNTLKRETGEEWKFQIIQGYSQGEWQYIFYKKTIKESTIEYIEDLYFCKYKEFEIIEDGEEDWNSFEIVTDSQYYEARKDHDKPYSYILTERLGKPVTVETIKRYKQMAEYEKE